ncbi:MAG: phosphate ABC transporter substrate-binding protein [Kiritimatiellia bacterium]|jgi:phosphate transport system substrate-binding protein
MKKIVAATTAAMLMGIGAATAGDANKIVVDGSTTVGPIAKAFAEHYMGKHPEVNITVSESGSGNGAKGIINETCDVGTMSRPMKKSEKDAANSAGVLPIEHIVAMDGIAVVVHESNPLQGLTIEQIRDIYIGKIANWKALGGPDRPIVAISRDTNSGTYETFETLVMKGAKMAGKTEYVGSNGAIRQRVLSTEGAIGYVGLAFREGVKALKVNGREATPEAVVAMTYPIARPLYMYTNGRPKQDTPLYDFITLSDTAEGKKIIADTGFVPVK